jgi:filamentous hemagglutinin
MRFPRQRFTRLPDAVLTLGALSAWCGSVPAGPALPVPCAPAACGITGPSQFVTSGSATAVAAQNALTVHQTTNSAILNWSSFNIGAGGSVTFKQPTASSVALNRIFQGSPSQIFGKLNANGQIYLINLDGFLFGATSTVNVGSLLVSSLPLSLTDANFNNGILSPLQSDKPVLDAALDPLAPGVGRASVLDSNGKPVLDAAGKPIPVQIVVQPGAALNAADQGRLLLAGQSVTNGGSLTAPDGQVILAAGTQVFLQADNDPSLRGLVVEVDGTPNTAGAPGNTAWNQLSGLLSAPRGNVTMVGLAVNQDGRISATTSVSANGSIRLEAAGGAANGIAGAVGDQTVASTQGGELTIGPQSQMDILPEVSSGSTAVAAQTQYPSSVTLLGEQVIVQGGSIVAPGGNLTAIAAANPSAAFNSNGSVAVVGSGDQNARVRIDSGTTIDLSGSAASLPVTANLVEAQLRSSELADDPTQRNGPLHGLTVFVDARLGSPPIANLSGEIDNVPQNIAQRTETGGTAIIQSEGNIVFAGGASLNVSGGKTTYAGGILQTTYLVGANGQLYPIATANPLMSYVGVVNPTVTETFDKWGIQNVLPTPGLSTYQPGYVQGAPAGSVQFAAPTMVLQGTLEGSAVNGLYQRTPATAVSGGRLTIGIPGGIGDTGTNPPTDYLSPGVRLTAAPYAIVVADDAPLLGPLTLDMPTSYLTSSGFTATQIYSNYDVQLPGNTPLALPPGSTFTVNASRVDLLSGISDPGGTLSFNNVINVGSSSASTAADRPGVYVGDGVTLDVRGLWTNDLATPNASALPQTWQNGGNISVGTSSPGALLSIGSDVTLHASGGAWMNNSGTLTNGSGGSIALNAGAVGGGLDAGAHLAIDAFGVNGAAGGSFTVTAPRVEISTGNSAWTMAQQVDDALAPGGVFQIYSGLFSNYGFQNINVTASGLVAPGAATANVLTVDPGTVISATVSSLELDANVSMRPSAATITGVADVTTLAPYLRPAAAVSLSALPPSSGTPPTQIGSTTVGDVSIGKGASITTDAGGSIALTSLDSIMVDGTLRAPGGAITLHILSPEQLNASNTAPLYGGYEAGFLPNQQIQLGASSTVDVSGTLVSKPSPVGLDLGTIYAGGTVNLFADRGAVVTDAGSLISVAGVSAAHDTEQPNGVYAHEVASSAAGSIAARSGESISLRGDIEAAAGSAGTSGLAAAGSLDVELTRSEPWWSPPTGTIAAATFNPEPLTVQLMPSVPSTAPSLSSFSNQAWLGATQISQSGLDALRLESGNDVEFSAGVALSLGRQLVIDAPVIAANVGANANLSAPYVQIGYELAGTTPQNTNAALGGTGTLSFSGSEVDLVGTTAFQGASAVHLTSSGDMVLRGEALGAGANTFIGGLTVVGNLTLDAARIYPATATSYAISAQEDPTTGIPGIATIGQSSPNPGTPLSGGGALSITAYTVSSTGTLYAPFGTISLDATHALILGDGSLTSVSGGGLIIPFGETQFGGAQWIYGAYNGNQTVGGVPDRAVNLTSPSVTLTKQATIDLSGGGDLSAFEWVPGPGGSRDALAPAAVPGLYAILPSTRGQAAPQDPQNNDPSIGAAQSVYLSGGGGLAAGTYPLLPARYALAPGAFLIEVEPQFQSTNPGFLGALANGTPVVAGFFSYGSTGLHQSPGYTGFAVYPGSYGSELAAYNVSLASNFFSAAATTTGAPRPTLPADAGTLSINVGNALDVVGEVLTKASNGGLAAPIDISAADLVIGTPAGPVPADAVSISGSVLSSWQPGSLVLGGKMDPDTANAIDVIANTVTVGSGTTLTAGQIILVANQSVDVQNGASLQSTSAANGSAPVPLPPQQSIALIGSSGTAPGFLAVSDLNWLIPLRIGGTSPIGAATVAIDAGASIASRGSLSIDGLGGVTLNGTVGGPGAQWSLGSSSIAFVPSAVTADALSLNPALVAQLGSASAVRLASTGSIDFLTPTSLGVGASGTPTLTSLTLEASSLNNLTGTGGSPGSATTRLDAQTLMLEGSGASGSMPVAGPAGATLLLTAGELDVGPDTLSVNGFAATRADVSGAVIGKGAGGLSVGGDLTIASHGVTAATAAVTTINATGALSITSAVKGSAGKVPQLLGGTLILSGSTVDISGNVTAPAGGVTLAATHDLTVDSGATISTAGTLVSIGNQLVGTSGGSIAITAGDNLALNPGSLLDVSGAGTAAGGSLSLAAGGSATLGSTMRASGGSGGTGATGGSFSLDAGTLAAVGTDANPLTTLATALAAGNFNDAVDLRVHTGDLHLDAGSTLSANAVTLTADTGEVTVGGEISAPSGALRGTLSIFGGSGVELASGGALHADGGGPTGLGGTIEIGTGQLIADQTGTLNAYNGGSISLDSGSTISTAGAAGEGNLLLRAPALLASNDVAITTLASDMTGIGQIIVEPVLPFNTASFSSATAPTANDFQNVNQTVGNFMSLAQPKIAARLGSSGVAPLVVEAGVEIVALGALTLQSADGVSPALDLSSWRFNGAPVDFTVRAAGDLTIANTLTDGFGAATVGGVSQPILLAGPSSSIRLVAGADLASANPLAVISAGSGNLTIGTPNQSAVVRTGTGTIDLIAANDIAIEGEGSGAYTAGTPAIAPGGNAATPYINIPRALGAARAYGIVVPQSGLLMSFPTGGGNLVVSAGEDITTITPGSPASSVGGVTNWQLREGGNTYQPVTSPTPLAVPVEWGVNLAAYNWAFGSLGGGDVSIAAGRDVINVSAAAADSLLPPEGGGTQFVSSGGLSMTAGRNIGSVQVFLADGTGTVTAGGALTAVLPSINVIDPNVGSGFYLQSSTITVTARTGMAIDGIFNPTGFDQPNPTSSPDLVGNFLTLGANSALTLESAAGDINLGRASDGTQTLLGANVQGGAGADVVPASLSLEAPGGNISIGTGIGAGGTLALYPSSNGQLDLLAAQNIVAASGNRLIMSDAAPGSYATVANPLGTNSVDSTAAQFNGDLHSSDTAPALVTAGGSIEELTLSIPKAAQVVAGLDVLDLTYSGQNLNLTDQTVIAAGRNVSYADSVATSGFGISVGGPGSLDILAGRNVSLGFSQGAQTSGNLLNANLPTAQGADLTIATGLGTTPNFANFLTKIIAPSPNYQAQLISYVESLQGSSGLSFAAAQTAFEGLTPDEQRPLVDKVFFNELSLSGLADNAVPGAGFSEGYAAIDALYPGSRTGTTGAATGAYAGDLTLNFSKIYTLSGGDINLLVPGGLINVGLANPPATFSSRSASTLGIVAEGTGDVDIYSLGDVNVNSSRIFTLGGGNILIWSDEGSIDAGLGAKTSVSAPPPSILISSNGTVSLDFSGAATGSGIRTIQTEPDTPAGNVDLIAPVGTVNAGDAGIGASGNINIAALSVIGVGNIQFGGTATGVPAQVSNIGASLSGASNAASGATAAATSAVQAGTAEKDAAAPLAQTALSWLDVFVTGLGEENCKPDDIDCLRRQKTPTR